MCRTDKDFVGNFYSAILLVLRIALVQPADLLSFVTRPTSSTYMDTSSSATAKC